ncbi:MAG: hypothetical protein ACRC20_12255 [Segniliparus sp.]|uniref:hypothetical protein n=1 Tax=Segniliparus sp. TaxID=2804064 RepID=UPI003F418B48
MTSITKLDVLRAAVELWGQNDRAVTSADIAERFSVGEDLARLELLPLVADYFETSLRGDDGVVALRQPTDEARRLVSL